MQKNQIAAETVIGALKKLLGDPEQAKNCASSPQAVWDMIVGIDQQGYPIQGLQASTPLTQLIEDFAGRRTGILADGRLVEEIPGSALVVAGRSKYTLLVAGSAAKISLRGNDNGSAGPEGDRFPGPKGVAGKLQQARGSVKRRGGVLEEGHLLRLDMNGEGTFGAAEQSSGRAQYPILRPWLATYTPAAVMATATVEAAPSETAAPPTLTASPVVPSPALALVAPTGTPGALKGEATRPP